ETLATIHLARGDAARAEKEFRESLAVNATLSRAPLELGMSEAARGNAQAALDFYVTAAVLTKLKPADEEGLHAAYKKVHGSEAGLDAGLDAAYDAKFPNPVKRLPYSPSAARSARLIV